MFKVKPFLLAAAVLLLALAVHLAARPSVGTGSAESPVEVADGSTMSSASAGECVAPPLAGAVEIVHSSAGFGCGAEMKGLVEDMAKEMVRTHCEGGPGTAMSRRTSGGSSVSVKVMCGEDIEIITNGDPE